MSWGRYVRMPLDQLVAAEKKEKRAGYQERVGSFKRIRFMAFVEYWIAHYKLIRHLRPFLNVSTSHHEFWLEVSYLFFS